MHGSWNLGSEGRLGKLNSTLGIGGRCHRIIPPPGPPHPGQPTSTGTTVDLESSPVVVIHVFVVHSWLLTVSRLKAGGRVVIVEVGVWILEVDDVSTPEDGAPTSVVPKEDGRLVVSDESLVMVVVVPALKLVVVTGPRVELSWPEPD
jgi:hypothetical protein